MFWFSFLLIINQTKERRNVIKYGCYKLLYFNSSMFNFIDPNSFTMQNSLTLSVMVFARTEYTIITFYINDYWTLTFSISISKIKNKITDFFIVFGRVPLFYYFFTYSCNSHICDYFILVNGG